MSPRRTAPEAHPVESGTRQGRMRAAAAWLLCLAWVALAAACGGGEGGSGGPAFGIVSLDNRSDEGQAPVTVVSFVMQSDDMDAPTDNLLLAPVPPGGVVILGQFEPGTYDAVALLDTSLSVVFTDMEVRGDQSTTFVVATSPGAP